MTIGYFGMKAQSQAIDVPAYEIPYQIQMLILLAVLSIFAICSLIILIKLIKRLPKGEEGIQQDIQPRETNTLHYIPIIGIIILFIIINIKYLFL
jgi:hypothetical protein